MDATTILDLVLGNLGTLVLLILIVYALVFGGQLVPGKTQEETAKRAAAAEAESEKYAELLAERAEQVTELKVTGARLETELAGTRRDLKRLEKKQTENTTILTEIRDEVAPSNGEES